MKKGFFRFPAIYKETVIFTAEGDLWSCSIKGGTARRLTSHPGSETNAKISPDGKMIAFTGTYEGETEIFVMPIEGGLPERLTYDSVVSQVVGWTKNGKLIYKSTHRSTLPETRLYTIDPKTKIEEPIPLHQASDGSYDDKDKNLYFVRLPNQGSHTKRYKGGYIEQIWKFDGKNEAVNLTGDFDGTSRNPMYYDGRVYFLTDRDGTMNIWSMDTDGKDLKQHTKYKDFEVRTADLHDGKIAYMVAGEIQIHDIKANTCEKLDITLISDFDQTREKWINNPLSFLEDVDFSANGDKLLMTSRGRVFSIPTQKGRLIQATPNEVARYKHASFMPDGESFISLADKTKEFELHTVKFGKKLSEKQITKNSSVINLTPHPSPDGKFVVYGDKDCAVNLVDLKTGKKKQIAKSEYDEVNNFAWSPDSKFIAFEMITLQNTMMQIYIYDCKNNDLFAVTTPRYNSFNPVWSKDGKWLYFISNRNFNSLVESPWGERQPEPYFHKPGKLYLIDLIGKQRSPFLEADEYLANQDDSKKEKDSKDEKKVTVKINKKGIESRLWEVPLPADKFISLSVAKDRIFYLAENVVGENQQYDLKMVKIDNQKALKPVDLAKDISDYKLAACADKLLIQKGIDFFVIDSNAEKIEKWDEFKVDLSKWRFSVDPVKEWKQLFIDAWRMERDYFYDKNMHGANYDKLLKLHLPLVDKITDRDELNELIAMIVGELSALHTFVRGGDTRFGNEHIRIGYLGAAITRTKKDWVISHIYQSDPDLPQLMAPLFRPDLDIKEGDVITAIDGIKLSETVAPNSVLRGKVGVQVLLTTKRGKVEKEHIVKTISPEEDASLRYSEWEYLNRLKVEKASKNKIGYVHLRAMGNENYTEWTHNFYPIFDRQGLIIDVRNNRGGNIDSWILEKLMRKAWFYWQTRDRKPFWNMQYAFRGHIVLLCNEKTASDGEAFTEGFKRLGLGKVIGRRTWGGEIWLSYNNLLADRGIASSAQMGVYDENGEWLIEGWGAEPDIEVDNLPVETFKGKDRQLEYAIDYLEKLIKEDPREIPKHPEFPNLRPKK